MCSRSEKRQRYEGMRLHRASAFRETSFTKNHSCARRIRGRRGLRHPKQKLPLFPNSQFISHIIENVGSECVSRIGVRSTSPHVRGETLADFFPSSPAQVHLRVCRKSCCRIKTQPFTNRLSTSALRIAAYLPHPYPTSHSASTPSFLSNVFILYI